MMPVFTNIFCSLWRNRNKQAPLGIEALRLARQEHGESRAAIGVIFSEETAVMLRNDLLRDIQPQSRPPAG